MSLRIAAFLIGTLLTLGGSLFAAPELRLTINAGTAFGQTDYVLRANTIDGDQTVGLKSQLEFPLDTWLVGGALDIDWPNTNQPRWSLTASVSFTVSNPTEKMFDHDWYRYPDEPYSKFSYTESNVEMAGTLAEIEGSWWLLDWGKARLGLLAGYRHHLIHQDIIGYEGWQFDEDGVRHDLSGTARGIYYRLVYYLPHAGIRARLPLAEWLRWDAKLTYLQVFASDYDDHLLRNKISVANVYGGGGSLRSEFTIHSDKRGAAQPLVALYLEVLYLKATGDQTQTWYGNDPASEGVDDTGQQISGIPHDVESLQINVGIRIGFGL